LVYKQTIYGKRNNSPRRAKLIQTSCFLAQDRVAEFAKMSPPLTLKETMRAAGDPRLTDWHQKLVGKGHEKKNLEEKLNTDISKRDQVQTQMDKIRPDVEQFENRQNQEKEVSLIFPLY
jgi:chromosome segregation ATPase